MPFYATAVSGFSCGVGDGCYSGHYSLVAIAAAATGAFHQHGVYQGTGTDGGAATAD